MEENLSKKENKQRCFTGSSRPAWMYRDPFGTEPVPGPEESPFPLNRGHSELLGAAPPCQGPGPLGSVRNSVLPSAPPWSRSSRPVTRLVTRLCPAAGHERCPRLSGAWPRAQYTGGGSSLGRLFAQPATKLLAKRSAFASVRSTGFALSG